MSKLGERLLQSAKEARAIARGEAEPARTFTPPQIDVAAIRKKTRLSQDRFAQRYGLSVAAIRDWEQHRRTPDPAARTLLLVIDKEPEAVARALAGLTRRRSTGRKGYPIREPAPAPAPAPPDAPARPAPRQPPATPARQPGTPRRR